MADAALARARARALGANKATAAPAQASAPKSASSLRTVVLQDGTKVPEEYYDLAPADQQRLVELIKEKEAQKADDSLAIRMVGEALDWVDRSKAKWSQERSELLDVIAGLSARVAAVEQQDRTLQVQKSDALTDQQVELSQMTVNLQAVGAEQEANHQRRLQESEEQAGQQRQRLEATERLVSRRELDPCEQGGGLETPTSFVHRVTPCTPLQACAVATHHHLWCAASNVLQHRVVAAPLVGALMHSQAVAHRRADHVEAMVGTVSTEAVGIAE